MGKYKTLAKNTGFVLIGTIGSKLINIIMLPLYTLWLKPEEFGAVDTITTYSMFFIGFVCLCLPDAIFIFPYNSPNSKKKEYFSSGIIFSIIAIIISALIFFIVQFFLLKKEIHNVFSDYTWLIFWLMVTSYMQNYCQSFTRSLNKMMQYSIAGIVLTFATALFSVVFIPYLGLSGYALSLILAQLVAALYSFVAGGCFKYIQFKGNSWLSVKEMLTYSVPLLPNGIMWWLVNGLNRPVMEHFLGLVAIGLYAVANKFTGVLFSLLSILSTAWGNSVLEEYGKPGFERFYNNYIKMLGGLLFFGGYLMIIFSRLLVRMLATPEYYDAYYYISPLMAGIIFSGMSGAVGGIFSATKTSKYFFYSSLWGGICSIITLIGLTSQFGLMGTCISVALSFFIMFLSRVVYASKFVKLENIWFYIQLFAVFISMSCCEVLLENNSRYILHAFLFFVSVFICRKDIVSVIKSLDLKHKISNLINRLGK